MQQVWIMTKNLKQIKNLSHILMGIGFTLYFSGAAAAWLFSLKLYWVTIDGWIIAVVGIATYAITFFLTLKDRNRT